MPGRSGMDLLAEMKHRQPDVPVLILSLHPEEQFAVRALRAGAAGYLTKAAAPDQLVAAVTKVAKGGKYVSEALAERLVGDIGGKAAAGAPHERLSDREFDILRGIASGKTVSEIAEEMKRQKINKSTMAKLMATSRAQLDRLLDGTHDVTLDMITRAATALKKEVLISFK